MAVNWELIGQTAGIVGIVTTGAYGVWRGHRKSDGSAPVERVPSQSDVKAELAVLRERIDRHAGSLGDDLKDMKRSIERLERMVERMTDRMDAEARIGSALARISMPRE